MSDRPGTAWSMGSLQSASRVAERTLKRARTLAGRVVPGRRTLLRLGVVAGLALLSQAVLEALLGTESAWLSTPLRADLRDIAVLLEASEPLTSLVVVLSAWAALARRRREPGLMAPPSPILRLLPLWVAGLLAGGMLCVAAPGIAVMLAFVGVAGGAVWAEGHLMTRLRRKRLARALESGATMKRARPRWRALALFAWQGLLVFWLIRQLWRLPGRLLRVFFLRIPRWLLAVAAYSLVFVVEAIARAWQFQSRLRVHPGSTMVAAAAGWVAVLCLLVATTPYRNVTSGQAERVAAARLQFRWLPGPFDAAVATATVKRAVSLGDQETFLLALESGSADGVFRVDPAQVLPNGCPRWKEWAGLEEAKLQELLQQRGKRLEFQPPLDSAGLLHAARCSWKLADNSFRLTALAGHTQGMKLDPFEAVDTAQPALLALLINEASVRASRDWQGRTLLHAALDRLAEARAGTFSLDARQRDLALRQEVAMREMVERLLAAQLPGKSEAPALDNAQRSIGFLGLQAGLPPAVVAGLLDGMSGTERTASGATLFHAAAASGDLALLGIAKRQGAPLSALTHDGMSPLHFASGRIVTLQLISWKLDPDLADRRRQTPLHLAVIRRDLDASLVLARYGSGRLQNDLFGKTPLDYAPPPPVQPAWDGQGKRPPAPPDPWLPLRVLLAGDQSPEDR